MTKAPGSSARGDSTNSFGGTWHVIKVHAAKSCSALVAPTDKVLEKGESLSFTGDGIGVIHANARVQSDEVIIDPPKGNTLRVLAGPLKVQLLPVGSKTTLCT